MGRPSAIESAGREIRVTDAFVVERGDDRLPEAAEADLIRIPQRSGPPLLLVVLPSWQRQYSPP